MQQVVFWENIFQDMLNLKIFEIQTKSQDTSSENFETRQLLFLQRFDMFQGIR